MIDQQISNAKVPNLFEDPNLKSIAQVYVDAFLDADGEQTGEERLDELDEFLQVFLDPHPQFEEKLISPVVSSQEKTGLLQRVVLPHVSPRLGQFLQVLAAHDRLELLRAIAAVGRTEQEVRSRKSRVVVTTASALSEEKLNQIRQRLSEILSTEPVLHVEIDPSLIGGLMIQIGDTVYDSSLRNRLGQLQSRLRQRYVHEIQSGRDRFSHSERS